MGLTFRDDFTVDLVDHMGDDDSVLSAMLVSTLNDDTVADMDDAGRRGRINFLMSNRHGTPFEHNSMKFRVEAPICVYREWHRHRIGVSINEQSGRYTKFEPVFYVPPPDRPLVQVGKPGAYEYVPGTEEQHERHVGLMKLQAQDQWDAYEDALESGIAKEVARMHLGVNIYSSMYWTCNARSLMAFLGLRTRDDGAMFPSKPMWEIDKCARMLEEHFKRLFPITWETWNANGRVAP